VGKREELEGDVIFHRQQLWLLTQLGILVCSEDTAELASMELERAFGKACLMANDIINKLSISPAASFVSESDKDKWMVTALLPSLSINVESRFDLSIGRAELLWREILESPELASLFRQISKADDVNSLFAKVYGVTFHEFIEALIAVFCSFLQQREHRPHLLKLHSFPEADRDRYRRALCVISKSPNEMAQNLIGEPRQSWSNDYTPLSRFPLLEVFPDEFCCPDLELFSNFFCSGIYWLMADAMRNNGSARFPELFGHVFGKYVNRLIGQFSNAGYPGSRLKRTFINSPVFTRQKNAEACDALLYWDKTAAVVEYKASLLPRHLRFSGDGDAILLAINKLFSTDVQRGRSRKQKGTAQLAKTVSKIKRGARIRPREKGNPKSLKLTGITLFPVMILFDDDLVIHAVRNHLERRFHAALEKLGVDRTDIGPLLLFSSRDIEAMECVSWKHSVEQAVCEYAAHIGTNLNDRLGNFTSFVYNKYGDLASEVKTLLQQKSLEAMQRVSDAIPDSND
jgi:hypothetical protein